MPVRAKRNKRRAAATAPQWEMVFTSGHDYFGELSDVGVKVDAYSRPDRAEVLEAWRRFGLAFLAVYDGESEPWALEQFGEPDRRGAVDG